MIIDGSLNRESHDGKDQVHVSSNVGGSALQERPGSVQARSAWLVVAFMTILGLIAHPASSSAFITFLLSTTKG